MTVYVLTEDIGDWQTLKGVYSSLELAQGVFPKTTWAPDPRFEGEWKAARVEGHDYLITECTVDAAYATQP